MYIYTHPTQFKNMDSNSLDTPDLFFNSSCAVHSLRTIQKIIFLCSTASYNLDI